MSAEPQIGLFWIVALSCETIVVLRRGCTLSAAVPYGDCLTFEAGHYETWRDGREGCLPLEPSLVGLRRVMTETEYEEWPRGRVIHERGPDGFVIYADRQAFPYRQELIEAFRLPSERTRMRTDLHYRSTRWIRSGAVSVVSLTYATSARGRANRRDC